MEKFDNDFDSIFGNSLPDHRQEDWAKLENILNLNSEKVKFEVLKKRIPTYLGIAASFLGFLTFTIFANYLKINKLENEIKKQKIEINNLQLASKSAINNISDQHSDKQNKLSKISENSRDNEANYLLESKNFEKKLGNTNPAEMASIKKDEPISVKKTPKAVTLTEYTKNTKSKKIFSLSNKSLFVSQKTTIGKKYSDSPKGFQTKDTTNNSYYIESPKEEVLGDISKNVAQQLPINQIEHRFFNDLSQLSKLKKIKKNGLFEIKNSRYPTNKTTFSIVPSHYSIGIFGGISNPISTNFIETSGTSYGAQLGIGYNNAKNNEFLTFTIGYNFNNLNLRSENENISIFWRKRPGPPLRNYKRYEINNFKNEELEVGAKLTLVNYKGIKPYLGANWAMQKTTNVEIFNIIKDPKHNIEEIRTKELDENLTNIRTYYYGANIGLAYEFSKKIAIVADYKYQIPLTKNDVNIEIATFKAGINYHFQTK